ncbi:MAG TPA: iron transporter [Kaistia sp.]|nr:iron transporter [Kaistia sp.]
MVVIGADQMVGRARLRGASFVIAMILAIATARADDGYQKAGGLAVYLGIVPAAVVRGHPMNHAESTMHGGPGTARHQYHLVVAVFDAQSGARVENARVSATISGLGHVGQQTVQLDPMKIENTVTYGNFVTLSGNDRYDIAVDITVPGRSRPVSVTFPSDHQ